MLYNVTTLHFERGDEDELRKVRMSKEPRAGHQGQAGLLAKPWRVPLQVHLSEGNTAGTTTLILVLSTFAQHQGVRDMVLVADAGMLSAANLNALEDAGFSFIAGSRIRVRVDFRLRFLDIVFIQNGEPLKKMARDYGRSNVRTIPES